MPMSMSIPARPADGAEPIIDSMLLMEGGVNYSKQRLHQAGYFRELLATNPDINEGLKPLLQLCRER